MTRDAAELLAVCRSGGVPLIINDRLDVALACGADGVHIGQDDLDPAAARSLAGPDFIIGVSVRTPEECRDARESGADYLAANGIFSTTTKTDFGEPLGLEGLKTLAEAAELPLVAIGGIRDENAADVIRSGADGVAVISCVVSDPDIAGRCRALLAAIEEGRRG